MEIEIVLSSQRVPKKEEQMAVKIKIGIGGRYYIDIGYRRFFNKKVKVIKKLDNGAYKVKLLEEAGLTWPKFTKITNVNGDELSLKKHSSMKRAFNEDAPTPQQKKVRREKGTSEDRRPAKKDKKKGSGVRRTCERGSSKRNVHKRKKSR